MNDIFIVTKKEKDKQDPRKNAGADSSNNWNDSNMGKNIRQSKNVNGETLTYRMKKRFKSYKNGFYGVNG